MFLKMYVFSMYASEKKNTNNKINKNKHVYKTKLVKYNCEMHSFSQPTS